MDVKQSSVIPVINYEAHFIKMRAKNWIEQIRKDHHNKLLLVGAMVDDTKVSTVGEFSHNYNAWVGVRYPNHCIDAR